MENIRIDGVWPWGRTLDEYRSMFALSDGDLRERVLGCADGPASFNAELSRRGGRVVSCDPLYKFRAEEIGRRIDETYPEIMAMMRRRVEHYVWKTIPSPDLLGEIRMAAMRGFLGDFGDAARRGGRYIAASVPNLPFADGAFGLALCSHFLFLYSDEFTVDFHVAAAAELCRVAREARIFPLLTNDGTPSPWVDPVIERLRGRGIRAQIREVDYEFQRGGNRCLVLNGAS